VVLASGQPRDYFDLSVQAGTQITDTVRVANPGTAPETLKISASTGSTSPTSGLGYVGYFAPCVDAGCWVGGLPPTVTLSPGSTRLLSFTVTVPPSTSPGQYLAGITAQPLSDPQPIAVGSNGAAGASAIVVSQVDVGVAITVGVLAQLSTRLLVSAVTSTAIGPVLRASLRVENPGQTFVKTTGTLSCTVAGRDLSFPVTVRTVLPGQSADVEVNAAGLPLTTPTRCSVRLPYGSGAVAAWSGSLGISAGSTPTAPPTAVAPSAAALAAPATGGTNGRIAELAAVVTAVVAFMIAAVTRTMRRRTQPRHRQHPRTAA
jgi:hypothetical protein